MRISREVASVLVFATVLSVAACASDEPASPSTASVDLCEQKEPRAIAPTFSQGDTLPDKTLALTFDDGPSEISSELSAYLKSQGVAATFFVNGANVEGLEDVLPQLARDGHLIGNHTQTHAALTTLSAAEAVDEVEQTDAIIAALVPAGKLFFRPPYGDWSEEVQRAVASSSMNKYQGPIGWDIGDHLGPDSAADWDCWDEGNGTRTVAECGALYLQEIRTKKKGIVLLHDGPPGGEGRKTLEMIEAMVPTLKDEGYTFVRVDAVFGGAGTGAGAGGSGSGSGKAGGSASADPCSGSR